MAKRKPSGKQAKGKSVAAAARPKRGTARKTRRHAAAAEPLPATADTAVNQDQVEDAPDPSGAVVHLATCDACQGSVSFTRSASGSSFTILDRVGYGVEAVFGISRAGLPICSRCYPNGHVAMTVGDDHLVPATDAISEVAALTAPTQAQLFEIAKPFNFEGAWLEIETKQGEIDALVAAHEADAAQAKRSKKLLEEAQTLLGRMVNTYRARRLQKAKDQAAQAESIATPADTAAVVWDRCSYERASAQACPVCTAPFPALVLAALESVTPEAYLDRASEAHRQAANDAESFDRSTIESLITSGEIVTQALELTGWFGTWDVVDTWTDDERAEVLRWAEQGRPATQAPACVVAVHVAGPMADQGQHCARCGSRLVEFADIGESYPEGAAIGTHCPGEDDPVPADVRDADAVEA